MRRRRDDDGDEVIRDGGSVRVPLMLRDGTMAMLEPWQRDALLSMRYRLDDDVASKHRPGFRYSDAAANRAKSKVYNDSIVEASNAWRGPVRDQEPRDVVRGPIYDAERGVAVKDAAYRRMVDEMTNAWRQPAGDASPQPRGQREGDVCAPGHLNARLECIADPQGDATPASPPRTMSADEAWRIRSAAYEQYCDELRNAWKGPQS